MKRLRPRRRRGNRPPALWPFLLLIGLLAAPAALSAGLPIFSALVQPCLHFLRFCFASLVRIDPALHGLPVLAVLGGFAYAIVRRTRLVRRGWSIVGQLPLRSPLPGEPIYAVASRHGALHHTRIIRAASANPAFTAGLLRPRMYLAEPLLENLSEPELEAVLLHELHHCRRRDPLRGILAAAVGDVFFWIPLVRDAIDSFRVRTEFAADDAARRVGDLVLAEAILKTATIGSGAVPATSAFAAPELIERRVERLLGDTSAEVLPPPSSRALAISALAIGAFWLLGVASSASHAAHVHAFEEVCPHAHEHGVLHASAADHAMPID